MAASSDDKGKNRNSEFSTSVFMDLTIWVVSRDSDFHRNTVKTKASFYIKP